MSEGESERESERDPVNVGIHGLGWVAGAHIETLKEVEGARVTAACSRRDLDREELAETYGIPIEPYQDYEEMLRDESLDVIDICSPSPYHAEQAVAAARAGKDIILEKPIALTWEDVLRVREAVEETGANVCVCFEVRFSEQATTLHSAIEEEMIGDVHYAEVDYYHGVGPWYGQFSWNVEKEGGGSSLLSAGCHALDLLLWYVDEPVEEVTSYGTKTDNEQFEPYEYDTTTVTILRFADGTVGKVASVIDCLQPYYFHMHLVGSRGTILDDKFHSEAIEGLDRDSWSEFATPLVDSGDVEHHPYLPQFRQFVESLAADEPMPRTDFETALESHRVIFAADRSAEEGRPVAISELAE
jgi:predicted dehydrogenase